MFSQIHHYGTELSRQTKAKSVKKNVTEKLKENWHRTPHWRSYLEVSGTMITVLWGYVTDAIQTGSQTPRKTRQFPLTHMSTFPNTQGTPETEDSTNLTYAIYSYPYPYSTL